MRGSPPARRARHRSAPTRPSRPRWPAPARASSPRDDRRDDRLPGQPRQRELVERVVVARANPSSRSTRSIWSSASNCSPSLAPGREAGALGRRLAPPVLAGEDAAREREVGRERHAEALERAGAGSLRPALQEAVLVLHVDERAHAAVGRRRDRLVDLCRAEVRAADLPHLARRDELVERFERVADRRRRDRAGAAGRGRCGRCPAGAGSSSRGTRDPVRAAPTVRPSGGWSMPNLVVITTSSRRVPSARPRNSSEVRCRRRGRRCRRRDRRRRAPRRRRARPLLVDAHAEVVAPEARHRDRGAARSSVSPSLAASQERAAAAS